MIAALAVLVSTRFVQIDAGVHALGKQGYLDNPLRKVRLMTFSIAATETTNAEFAQFVNATGYVTDAEKLHNAMVFEPGLKEFRWIQDQTAFWRFPNGVKRGGIEGKFNHPVTTISFRDAQAYCKWAKVRLPSLDEWEAACRAGTRTDYFFGSNRELIKQFANIWHGRDHLNPDVSDGFMYTSPVGSFKPNPWGLYDMYGNVFEFCTGKLKSDKTTRAVHARGGSWWCSKNACNYFTSMDIGGVDIAASFSNHGFRVVRDRSDNAEGPVD